MFFLKRNDRFKKKIEKLSKKRAFNDRFHNNPSLREGVQCYCFQNIQLLKNSGDFVEIWINVTLIGGLIYEKFISSASSSIMTYPIAGVQILREQNTCNLMFHMSFFRQSFKNHYEGSQFALLFTMYNFVNCTN